MAKTRPGASKKGRSKKTRRREQEEEAAAAAGGERPGSRKPASQLVDEAMIAMTQGDVGAALAAATRALQRIERASGSATSTSNNTVVDGVGKAAACALLGEIHLEAGDPDAARALLLRAVALDPQGTLADALGGGIDKFLYLAQLSEEGGRDSVAWFDRGAAALRARIAADGGAAAKTETAGHDRAAKDDDDNDDDDDDDKGGEEKQKLAQVLCAVAEVWMTDLSFEADCEARCEALVTEAALLAPRAPDVWQTLASVRISQSRPDEARAALERSLALWTHLPPEHPAVPAFPVRVGLVRLLLTVGWLDMAADVVAARLLREDDEAVEVWYLAGYAHHLQGEEAKEKAPDADTEQWHARWRSARRCLARCLRLYRLQAYEDERLRAHAEELLAEVEAVVGPAPKEAEEDDEWEDDDDEDDEDDEGDEGDDEDGDDGSGNEDHEMG